MLKTPQSSARIKSQRARGLCCLVQGRQAKLIVLSSNVSATIENAGFKKIRSNGYRYVD